MKAQGGNTAPTNTSFFNQGNNANSFFNNFANQTTGDANKTGGFFANLASNSFLSQNASLRDNGNFLKQNS